MDFRQLFCGSDVALWVQARTWQGSITRREARRLVIGSFQPDREVVIVWRLYRITAATDDGSFSFLFQNSYVIYCCLGVKTISNNIVNIAYLIILPTLALSLDKLPVWAVLDTYGSTAVAHTCLWCHQCLLSTDPGTIPIFEWIRNNTGFHSSLRENILRSRVGFSGTTSLSFWPLYENFLSQRGYGC